MEIRERPSGFSIMLNGGSLIEHSQKKPLLSFSGDSHACAGRFGRMRLAAKDWKILPSEPGSLVVEFPGFLRMSLRRDGFAVRIAFDGINPRLESMRIRLPKSSRETIYGLADGFPSNGFKAAATGLLRLLSPDSGQNRALFRATGLRRGKNYGAVLPQSPSPRFAGNKGFFLSVESAIPLRIDLRRNRRVTVDLSGIPAGLTLGQAGSQLAARTELNRLAIKKSRIPSWSAQGIWLSLYGGEALAAKNLSTVLDAGVSVSAIVLKDWAGMRTGPKARRYSWSWSADARRYATLEDDIARFRQADIRVLGSISPYLDEDSPDFPNAKRQGWLITTPSGEPHLVNTCAGRAGFVDLWNPDACAALKSMISKNILGSGMSGWVADHGFFVPQKKIPAHGRTALRACMEYSALWSALNAEALRESGNPSEIACIMRSGNCGTAAGNGMHIVCAQSRDASWGRHGLAGEIDARVNEPGIFYAETGGSAPLALHPHKHPPSGDARELFMRWTETSAFSPLFCNSDASSVQPWTDAAILAHFGRMATVHTLLGDYHRSTLEAFHREGTPPVTRPSVLYGTRQGESGSCRHYMYGRDLLVMPILAPGKTFSRGILPDDEWIHLWTTREFNGGEVTVEALLGYPAVFFRADSRWAGLFDKVRLEAKRTE